MPRSVAAAALWRDLGVGLLGDEALELEQLGVVEIELVEVAVDDLLDQPGDALEQLLRGPPSNESNAQASDAIRLMKRRTGWRRDEKKLPSTSAARSTGSCRRAIWRAISGGTRASERIWSNRLLTTSITRWSSLPREACSSSARWARIRFDAIRPVSPLDGGCTYGTPSGTPVRVVGEKSSAGSPVYEP